MDYSNQKTKEMGLRSPRNYPRTDNVYMVKSSLNFDAMRAKIYEDRRDDSNNAQVWMANALIGFCCGFAAFAVNSMEEGIAISRFNMTQDLINGKESTFSQPLWFYILSAAFLVLCAGLMTVFLGPGAAGSGISELMGTLNGINVP
jgi:H+/Cl- antiporter ClcA